MKKGFKAAMTAAALLALCTCGGSRSPSGPSPPPGPGPGPTAATITITASGVSPNSVQVTQGSRVLFINNHNVRHEMTSDPHPEHTQCPEINQVGDLAPGQQRETGNLNNVRTCGFHDHRLGEGTPFDGTIIVTPR